MGRAEASLPGYWFPVLLIGLLVALSLPLSMLKSPSSPQGIAVFAKVAYPTVTAAMYLGGGSGNPPFPFPLGWYWLGVLVTGSLLTVFWCRRLDRRYGTNTPVRGYVIAGLALAAVTVALPSLAWGTPIPDGPGSGAFTWLTAFWEDGTFALLGVSVNLAIYAWLSRSRALASITVAYTAAVVLAAWLEISQVVFLPTLSPVADPAVLLPVAVLTLAGIGAASVAGLRSLRTSHPS